MKCPQCGSSRIRKSHSKNFRERLKKLLRQRAYRCHDCNWRGILKSKSSRFRLVRKDKKLAGTMLLILTVIVVAIIISVVLAYQQCKPAIRPKPALTRQAVVPPTAPPPAPVVIQETPTPAAINTPPPTVAPEESIRNLIAEWLESWKSGDMETYRSCYAPDFQSRGMNLDAWVAHKTKIIRNSKKIDIRMERLQITARENDATAAFVQHYSSSASKNSGKKTLELKKTDGQWRIYRETM